VHVSNPSFEPSASWDHSVQRLHDTDATFLKGGASADNSDTCDYM